MTLEEFISKIQYLIGEYSFIFLQCGDQRISNSNFQKAWELSLLLDFLTSGGIDNKTIQYTDQLIAFFSARYNFNVIPFITYPNKITPILYGFGVSSGSNTFVFSGVDEAPVNGLLHARINKQWQSITIPDSYTKVQSDALYYPLNSNPAGYITSASLHNAVTIGTSNGLSLLNQQLSLALATTASPGAMSANDKIKLDGITSHSPVTLGISNGLSLSNQELSLGLATTLLAGAMSASDKIKLESLSNYIHPSGFTNQPVNPLTGPTVISRITVNNEGHVTGVSTRDITANDLGIVPNALTKTDDTNVTLTVGGTPTTSLLQPVSLTLGWAGLLSVARGGTGAGTFTSGEVLVGNGINAVSTISRNGIDTRVSFPAEAHNLTSHTDVSLTIPSINQVLGYNGTSWTNITLDLNNFSYTETDPIFVAFRDTVRTAKTFYSAPTASNAIASFRTIIADDLPNVYVRFDIPQTLTELEKQRVRTTLGVNNLSGSFEPAFSKGDITTTTPTIISLTNGIDRLVGLSDLIINHATSGWVAKTTLTGANIISNLTVDAYGHVSNWTTRVLTLADLGFVAFDPTSIENTLSNHESRITTLENTVATFPSDKNFVHVQSTAAAIWTFTHNLGKKPSVTIIDSAGSIILAKITYTNLNSITIDFNGSATSGEAICN